MGIKNVATNIVKLAELGFSSRLGCQISFEMLEDHPRDQVGCQRSLRDDQNGGGATAPTVHMPSRRPWAPAAPLHFGHRGGCASCHLDHGVDLQAS